MTITGDGAFGHFPLETALQLPFPYPRDPLPGRPTQSDEVSPEVLIEERVSEPDEFLGRIFEHLEQRLSVDCRERDAVHRAGVGVEQRCCGAGMSCGDELVG